MGNTIWARIARSVFLNREVEFPRDCWCLKQIKDLADNENHMDIMGHCVEVAKCACCEKALPSFRYAVNHVWQTHYNEGKLVERTDVKGPIFHEIFPPDVLDVMEALAG